MVNVKFDVQVFKDWKAKNVSVIKRRIKVLSGKKKIKCRHHHCHRRQRLEPLVQTTEMC